jgi:uncharacterized cupin superfamily protein
MKKIDLSAVPVEDGSNYPPPFDRPCFGQTCQRLSRFQGIERFGVNLSVIPPGGWSSQRHWHSHEDPVNKSDAPARVLEIGNSDPADLCRYSDIDMVAGPGASGYSYRNGRPYPDR